MIERARHWADVARHAPSGDNSQPWQVGLGTQGENLVLTLELDEATKAAPSLFDCDFAASFLSLGAFARNFSLMAGAEGWQLADLREDTARFTLSFAPGATHTGTPAPDEVAAVIRRRATSRLPFKREQLDEAVRSAFAGLAAGCPGNHALEEFNGEKKKRLAGVFYALDVIRYRNARLYTEFLGKLRFGPEAAQTLDGLRDTTLGAPPPALWFLRALRALRNVRAVHALFFLGLERIMAFVGCLVLVRNSAAVFVLSSGDDTPLGWFRLGFCFEDLWLEATRRKLALQPLGTTLLLYRNEREQRRQQAPAFNAIEQARLRALGDRFKAESGLDPGLPCIAFRVGRAPEVANGSVRRPIEIRT